MNTQPNLTMISGVSYKLGARLTGIFKKHLLLIKLAPKTTAIRLWPDDYRVFCEKINDQHDGQLKIDHATYANLPIVQYLVDQ